MSQILKMNITYFIINLVLFFSSCEPANVEAEAITYTNAEMVQMVNEIRSKGCKCGSQYYPAVGPVEWNNTLQATALAHSKDMATRKYFAHVNKKGENAEGRLDRAGYVWRSYGENIYQNTDPKHNAADAIQAWKDSPGHCANMMKPYFTEMGIGSYQGYWTQLFGSR